MTIAEERIQAIRDALNSRYREADPVTIEGLIVDALQAVLDDGGGGGGGEDTGWLDLVPLLVNDWAALGAAEYRKINGVVYLRGQLSGDAVFTGDGLAATFPAGFRPEGPTDFVSVADGVINAAWSVGADGNLSYLDGVGPGPSQAWLSPIIYPVAAP